MSVFTDNPAEKIQSSEQLKDCFQTTIVKHVRYSWNVNVEMRTGGKLRF